MNIQCESIFDRFPELHDFQKVLGNTPLVEVPSPVGGGKIFAKLESHNPTGTVKDRTAFALVANALGGVDGSDRSRIEILEYTGGSLGVSLAEICKRLKIRCRIVMSEATNAKIVDALKRYDVRLDWVDSDLGFYGVMKRAIEISKTSDAHFLYQHENQANLRVHRDQTGPEILRQLGNRSADAWIASIGTGGTLCGVFACLKERFPNIKMFATSPAEMPYGTEQNPNSLPKFAGSGGLGYGLRQSFVKPFECMIDRHLQYTFEESTVAANYLTEALGFNVGTSSGANWKAAFEVALTMRPDQTVVTVFPS